MLALITLASVLVACKKDGDGITADSSNNSNDSVASTDSSDTDEQLDVEDDLPETMDFDKRVFNILARVEGKDINNCEITAESTSGNIVDSAV